MKLRRSSRLHGAIINIAVLGIVALLLVFVISLVRIKLLQNAQNLGMALVHSYAVEEQMTIDSLTKTAMLAGQYVGDLSTNGGNIDDIQAWLMDYFSKLTDIIGEGIVDPYAVIDGQTVAANPWDGDGSYNYADTDWYQQAIAADGEVVCGAVYTDSITGQQIFTISQALPNEGDVFAMDVYVQNREMHHTAHTLPEDYSYYLCNEKGELLYSITKWNVDEETQHLYTEYLMAGIADGSLLAYDASYEDADGVSRGVYYQTMSNGWTVIITIPISTILMGEPNTVVYIMALVALFLFAVLALMTIRDIVKSRHMKKADATAHLLGDSFYAIFSVNFQTGTYESFKVADDLRNALPHAGDYSLLLKAMRTVVSPATYHAFEAGFSLDQIRQRVDQGIADYGGDYQRRFDEVYRWVNVRTLYDPQQIPDQVILCFRDVDEEKRRELQHTIILQEALEAAQKSTKTKAAFFSRMSHDMRTPLNAIIGCCDLAQKGHDAGDSSKVWTYIDKIAFAGRQLLDLINDILELSRIEAGKQYIDQKELDLKQLLINLTELFRDRAQEEGKVLEVSIDFRENHVIGDERRISQIVNNLLSNAIKYSERGATIRLEARQFHFQKHSKFQIIVEDTGIGMSPGFLEHLFDPYTRETAFSSHTATGTGLGMPIVKSLVQQMSGEISVHSVLGEGSRFTVTIPLKTAEQPAQAPEPDIAPAAPATFDWTGRQILVAEDNELNLEIVTELLQALGARVLPAVNGEEAVRVFLAAPPFSIDAVLMDMQMPEMDGCQAAAAIRALDRADAAGVPIIAVTANAFAEDIARTTRAGMNDHVSKPIDSRVLSQTMQKLITEWEARRGAACRNAEGRSEEP